MSYNKNILLIDKETYVYREWCCLQLKICVRIMIIIVSTEKSIS